MLTLGIRYYRQTSRYHRNLIYREFIPIHLILKKAWKRKLQNVPNFSSSIQLLMFFQVSSLIFFQFTSVKGT